MSEQYEYLVRGALLQCSCGSCQRRLNLPLCHGVYIGKNPVMNSGDFIPEVNIMSFGTCSKTDSKCTPGFAGNYPWLNVNRRLIIGDEENYALTTQSYLECVTGGRITVVTSGQEYEMTEKDRINKQEKFELTKEERNEIEDILASDGEWKDKVIKIKHIYEKHLYNLAPEAFDDYAKSKKALDKERQEIKEKNQREFEEIVSRKNISYEEKVIKADEFFRKAKEIEKLAKEKHEEAMNLLENNLKQELKGKVDIRQAGKALSDDVLRAIPKNEGRLISKLDTFYDLVKTGAPMDLKTHELSKATGNPAHDFSIWARGWEDKTEKYKDENGNKMDYVSRDYMGNFTFGYVGADYFKEVDFDDYTTATTMVGTGAGGVLGATPGAVIGGTITNMSPSVFRILNPDKTDEEMMLLTAAGVAQYGSNLKNSFPNPLKVAENTKKYISSIVSGNWGDNEKDSEYIKDGINYYYETNGIDKKEEIYKERQ